jgi:WD40 repeat protein
MRKHQSLLQTIPFSFSILLWLVSGCGPAIGNPTEMPTILPSATQFAITTSTSTPEPTKVVIQTSTSPSSAITIEKDCLTLQEQPPSDLNLEGVMVRNSRKPYLDNLENHLKYDIPLRGGGTLLDYFFIPISISPDGKRLAYLDTYLDTSGRAPRTTGYALRVMNPSGHSLNMDYWPTTYQRILGWKDSENLVIQLYSPIGDKSSRIIILDPLTGNWKEFQKPTWLTQPDREGSFLMDFNPKLDKVILGIKDHYEVREVESGDLIFGDESTGRFTEYAWSPDGTSVVAASEDGRTLHVIRGKNEVLHINILKEKIASSRVGFDGLIWSPDSKKILVKTYEEQLMIDLENNKILNLCFNDPQLNFSDYNPFTSPDGKYVITHMYWHQKGNLYNYQHSDILIDLDKMEAYQLPTKEGDDRIAWLAVP